MFFHLCENMNYVIDRKFLKMRSNLLLLSFPRIWWSSGTQSSARARLPIVVVYSLHRQLLRGEGGG